MRETTFENAKVGDRVWSFRYGFGIIVSINGDIDEADEEFIITVKMDNKLIERFYTIDGRLDKLSNQDLFWDEIKFEIPERPKRKVKKMVYIGICKIGNSGIYVTTHAYENIPDLTDNVGKDYRIITAEIEVEE